MAGSSDPGATPFFMAGSSAPGTTPFFMAGSSDPGTTPVFMAGSSDPGAPPAFIGCLKGGAPERSCFTGFRAKGLAVFACGWRVGPRPRARLRSAVPSGSIEGGKPGWLASISASTGTAGAAPALRCAALEARFPTRSGGGGPWSSSMVLAGAFWRCSGLVGVGNGKAGAGPGRCGRGPGPWPIPGCRDSGTGCPGRDGKGKAGPERAVPRGGLPAAPVRRASGTGGCCEAAARPGPDGPVRKGFGTGGNDGSSWGSAISLLFFEAEGLEKLGTGCSLGSREPVTGVFPVFLPDRRFRGPGAGTGSSSPVLSNGRPGALRVLPVSKGNAFSFGTPDGTGASGSGPFLRPFFLVGGAASAGSVLCGNGQVESAPGCPFGGGPLLPGMPRLGSPMGVADEEEFMADGLAAARAKKTRASGARPHRNM